MTAVLKFLRWLKRHQGWLKRDGLTTWILSFDAGIGVLVAAGAWFCAAEPALTVDASIEPDSIDAAQSPDAPDAPDAPVTDSVDKVAFFKKYFTVGR